MSFWQFAAACRGWAKANGAEQPLPPPTPEQHQYLIDKYG